MKHAFLFTLLCAAAAQAQTNIGAILSVGDDEFSYGASVSNGASVSVINLPTSSSSGGAVAMNFNVGDGASAPPRLRRAFAGNWFYRIQGDSRERNPANNYSRTLTSSSAEYWFPAVGPGGLTIPGLNGHYGFDLTDTGPNSSLVTTYLCFENNTQSTYNIETFLAVDLDLLGTAAGDIALPTQLGSGRLITTKEAGDTGVIYGPGAIGSGVGLNNVILGMLAGNNLVDDYTNDLNAGGVGSPSDLEGVVQFTKTVPPGAFICTPAYIGIGINFEEPIVPEPTCLGGILACGAFLIRRRR